MVTNGTVVGGFSQKTQNNDSVLDFDVCKAAEERISHVLKASGLKTEMTKTRSSLKPIGLKLKKTPSFLDSIEAILFKRRISSADENNRIATHTFKVKASSDIESEKIKASHLNAQSIKIGSFQKAAKNEGDLMAKFYYRMQRLAWEVLEDGLKSKIETQWSNIIGIKAILPKNQPGILHIELRDPPSFYKEVNPQPRKHTMWNITDDFTSGQALLHRRHILQFPTGELNRHYKKLLQSDSRLLQLNGSPFPTLNTPYFSPLPLDHGHREFYVGFSPNSPGISRDMMSPYPTIPTDLTPPRQWIPTYQQYNHVNLGSHNSILPIPELLRQNPNEVPFDIVDSTSPTSGIDISSLELFTKHEVEDPRMGFWGQELENARDQIQGLPHIATPYQVQVNPNTYIQNMVTNEIAQVVGSEQRILHDNASQLLQLGSSSFDWTSYM